MRVRVNGDWRQIGFGSTVHDLVVQLGYGDRQVVVERNGQPLERERFADVQLGDGDVVEVVRPVAGGAERQLGPLYLVAPGGLSDAWLGDVIDAGVDLVQLRMKEAEAREVLGEGERYLKACRDRGVPFIVNDRPDIVRALGADGVHLGQDDLPPAVARDIVGPDVIIGRSTHSPDDIASAVAEHEAGLADYIAVGPVHATPTKPGRPAVGLELVRHAADNVTLPFFAIGGIEPTNVGDVVDAGAQAIVVVRAIVEAQDPVAATRALKAALP